MVFITQSQLIWHYILYDIWIFTLILTMKYNMYLMKIHLNFDKLWFMIQNFFNSMSLLPFLSLITWFCNLNQLRWFEIGHLSFQVDTRSIWILYHYELILKIHEIYFFMNNYAYLHNSDWHFGKLAYCFNNCHHLQFVSMDCFVINSHIFHWCSPWYLFLCTVTWVLLIFATSIFETSLNITTAWSAKEFCLQQLWSPSHILIVILDKSLKIPSLTPSLCAGY